jgi:thiamine kinase-like enzyme
MTSNRRICLVRWRQRTPSSADHPTRPSSTASGCAPGAPAARHRFEEVQRLSQADALAGDQAELRGELRDQLVAALHWLPELAGRELRLTALSGGITNRNFLVAPAGDSDRYVIRLAGNDTHLLGISREVEHAATVTAAGVGVGPEVVAFIRPEGYLVTRFIDGRPVGLEEVRQPAMLRRVADSVRRVHGGPAIPGLFVPLRIVEAYRALAAERGVAIPPAYEQARTVGRRIEAALLAAPMEPRPCHNDLLNANFIDDGERIRIVDWEYAGMGDPFFDLGNFSVNHDLTPNEDAVLLEAYEGDVRPPRLARLELMRVVSDFREAMWGVLQQAISTLDVDFVAYADEHFERLLRNASGPDFRDQLGEAARG